MPKGHARLPQYDDASSDLRLSDEEALPTLVYENPAMMFSAIHEVGFRVIQSWKPWSNRVIKIYSDGLMTNARPSRPDNIPEHHKYLLTDIEVTIIENEGLEIATRGLKVKCLTMDNIETYFRCIAPAEEIDRFLEVLASVAQRHNIGQHTTTALNVPDPSKRRIFFVPGLNSKTGENQGDTRSFLPGKSAMRRAIGRAMDVHDKRSVRERILAKRGTMKYLPVLGQNDLIHGSW